MIQAMKEEGAKAKRWREELMGLSREALSHRCGFSRSAIARFENGCYETTGKPIPPREMQKYKLICAALESGLSFDWGRVTISL
jgi:transcriptional regulator with XRE-family HTH domain